MPRPHDDPVHDRLPLRPGVLAVLAALARGPAPGIAVLDAATAGRSGGILGPGTLYRLLRELRQDGLIVRTEAPADARDGGDERRQYHALTPLGRAVLEAEARRLRRTLGDAGLLAREGDA